MIEFMLKNGMASESVESRSWRSRQQFLSHETTEEAGPIRVQRPHGKGMEERMGSFLQMIPGRASCMEVPGGSSKNRPTLFAHLLIDTQH